MNFGIRGTLFFEVERILKEKQPKGFVLENVEGLVNHDRENKSDKIGRTLSTILSHLENLDYRLTKEQKRCYRFDLYLWNR